MKRVIVAVVFGFCSCILVNACTQENSVKVDETGTSSRVKLKEVRVIGGHGFQIVTVDDTLEFLVVDGHPIKIK